MHKRNSLLFLFCPFKFFEALPTMEDSNGKRASVVYVRFSTFGQRVLFPVKFKFRSTENLRNSVMKGELWSFRFWKLSLLNSINDSVRPDSCLTRETPE